MMKYPWKRDPNSFPDNYAQILKKLESTKQRLMKQPELSYDMQVKEMEEMKFSSHGEREERMEGTSSLCRAPCCSVSRKEEYTNQNCVYQLSISLKAYAE